MPITAVCPECEERYQLQPDMAGKAMTCKNPMCRASFTVPAPTASNWWEAQPEVRTAPSTPTPADPLVPPPVRKPPATATPRAPRTATATPAAPEPPTLAPTPTPTPSPTPAPAAKSPPKPTRPRSANWAARVVIGLLVAVPVILGAVAFWAYNAYSVNEGKVADAALQKLRDGLYDDAGADFGQLLKTFPTSSRKDEYVAMEKLAHQMPRIDDPGIALDIRMNEVDRFVQERSKDEKVKPFHPALGKKVEKAVKEFVQAGIPAKDDSSEPHVAKARPVIDRLAKVKPAALTPDQVAALNQAFGELAASVELWRHRGAFDEALALLVKEKGPVAELRARLDKLIGAWADRIPNLAADPKVVEVRNHLIDQQAQRIEFVPASAVAAPDAAAEPGGNLWVQAHIRRANGNGVRAGNNDVVLAVARGVLYALRRDDGDVAWAYRVGIDTTTLPVRVRGDAVIGERILVLSADRATVTALDGAGRTLWEHRTGEPSLGRPVVVGTRAYLALANGDVQEIETTRGRLLGTFPLGQRLSVGGVREKGTTRLYFAADDSCVYVLDVDPEQRRCVAVLHTGHPTGSLRAAPLVLPVEDPKEEGYPGHLVLTLARSLEETGLVVYRLPNWAGPAGDLTLAQVPADGRDFWTLRDAKADGPLRRAWPASSRRPRPELRLSGWTWFAPATDPEKIAYLTDHDGGRLGLFGIRQPLGRDPVLFPLLDRTAGGQPLTVKVAGSPVAPPRGRAQVVRMRGDDLWLLADGRLERHRVAWHHAEGPKLDPAWAKPLDLGDPIHLSQALADPRFPALPGNDDDPTAPDSVDGRAVLYVVTQPLDRPSVVVSAIEDETGRVLWQTQLGLVAATEPLRLKPAVGPEVLLLMDQAGTLHRLPADLKPAAAGWAGHETLLAESLADNPRWPPHLVRLADDEAVQVAAPGDGRTLVLRRVKWDANKSAWTVEPHEVALPAALAGTPAKVDDHLILPLADGNLHRLPLDGKPTLQAGPAWRDRYLGPETVGHVTALGGDRFVTTDGHLGLTVWKWAATDAAAVGLPPNRKMNRGREEPTLTLKYTPTRPPLFLPGDGQRPDRLLVADAAGKLVALEPKTDGKLASVRTFDLGGQASDGPYIATAPGEPVRVCIVVDRGRVFWLDPTADEAKRWQPTKDGEAIVGRPRLQGGEVWVAVDAGRVVTIDPATGKVGERVALEGSIAPATVPVPVGSGPMLLPLSDGTLRLLDAKE